MSTAPKFEYHDFEIGLCGFSGAGKTTLCRKLISRFSPRFSVGYVKSDAHFFEMDKEGKDTELAWRAGSRSVAIFDKTHSAILQHGKWDRFRQRTAFDDLDFVLVEGRKRSPLPKLVLLGGGGEILPLVLSGEIENVLAFVGEEPEPPARLDRPYFQRDDVAGISDFVEAFFARKVSDRPVRAVILAGGKSARMGTDKALLELGGETQLARAAALLRAFVPEVFVSTRPGQRDAGQIGDLSVIEDRFLDFGPLGGIASALAAGPDAAWLVLACDLPMVDHASIENLLKKRDPMKMATAYQSVSDELPEPLCAVYEPRAIGRVLQTLALGSSCPRKFLLNSPVRILSQPNPLALTNMNSPSEFQRVKRYLGQNLETQL